MYRGQKQTPVLQVGTVQQCMLHGVWADATQPGVASLGRARREVGGVARVGELATRRALVVLCHLRALLQLLFLLVLDASRDLSATRLGTCDCGTKLLGALCGDLGFRTQNVLRLHLRAR